MAGSLTLALTILAADPSPLPDEPPIDPSRVTPGILGFIAFAFLIVAVVLLYRSMRKQMKKISPDLPPGPEDRRLAADRHYTEEAEQRGERDAASRGDAPGAG